MTEFSVPRFRRLCDEPLTDDSKEQFLRALLRGSGLRLVRYPYKTGTYEIRRGETCILARGSLSTMDAWVNGYLRGYATRSAEERA